ncbi:MAG TPA: signal peptide peptidase SppA, partial [Vicinamibacteria bacterium]
MSAQRKPSGFFWFLLVSAVLLTFFAGSLYLVFRGVRGAVTSVARGSAVEIDLALGFPEDSLFEIGGPFFGYETLTFRDLLGGISRAKEDPRIEKLLLHVRPTGLGWAQATELREHLLDFKSSGKPLVAFVEYGSNRDYYLASVADEIYIHPRTVLDLRGVRAEALFLRSALEKAGVEAEFERFAAYKDAPDMFLRDEMSPESREALEALVSTIHDSLVQGLVQGRGMDRDQAAALIARGPFTAVEAHDLDLVDGLQYIDEVKKKMAPEGKEEIRTVSVADYLRASAAGPSFASRAQIAVIYGVGAIVGGDSSEDAVFGRVMGSDTIAEAFKSAREDESIDAVVFRIDSPGGSDVASDVIWREATLTRAKKPVVVSMADVAASGGYWVATASDAIVAEPTTVTGSIGIFAGKFNLAGLYDKIGVSTDGVESSANADFYSSSRSFTPAEREKLRKILESGYQAFLERVAESRKKTTDEVHKVAQGRVWSGRDAKDLGLVDELGGLKRALDLAKEKAGFAADAKVELRVLPQ